MPVSAIGSVLVLSALVVGLGYGGWTVLQNIQRVQFAPVEELPLAVAEVDAAGAPEATALAGDGAAELASPVAATALTDLYRQQELEVPILVPRDGPIAALDPDMLGPVAAPRRRRWWPSAGAAPRRPRRWSTAGAPSCRGAAGAVAGRGRRWWWWPSAPPGSGSTTRTARSSSRASSRRARAIRRRGSSTPLIWAGNSGSVYVRVGDELHGPLGQRHPGDARRRAGAAAIAERYAVVEDVPEVISRRSAARRRQVPAVALR